MHNTISKLHTHTQKISTENCLRKNNEQICQKDSARTCLVTFSDNRKSNYKCRAGADFSQLLKEIDCKTCSQNTVPIPSKPAKNISTLEALLANEMMSAKELTKIQDATAKLKPCNKSPTTVFKPYSDTKPYPKIYAKAIKKKIFKDLTHKDTNIKKNYDIFDSEDFDDLLAY